MKPKRQDKEEEERTKEEGIKNAKDSIILMIAVKAQSTENVTSAIETTTLLPKFKRHKELQTNSQKSVGRAKAITPITFPSA